ncbi:hypothetical protein NQ315_004663 [Exocentrus adspersus]|uniref:Tc1-like transposase DDE domain-containing protein n=1 Tax=Exocentrus adspersus TaxID=1586481 RepID=A0AAV8VPB4_9CUCU|nr:hypothetical protein NQ315_004663 [Exocentrus adspersus]
MYARNTNRKIYYVDETHIKDCLDEGHKVTPTVPRKDLIIIHIGSETGFLEQGLLIFESEQTGNCHEGMNSDVFEDWFRSVLPYTELDAVIVMDNTTYHNRQLEKPSSPWGKSEIVENIKCKKENDHKYAVDEMAAVRGITVLRLPPYHNELNPMELIWTKIKNGVSEENTTFNLENLKLLVKKQINRISAKTWSECVVHVQNEEQRLWDLAIVNDALVDPVVTTESHPCNNGSDR